jgi:predicted dehydrogenase
MKVGIVGAGMIVYEFLEGIQELNGIQITAICATSNGVNKMKDLCQKYNIPQYYTDIDTMLKNDNVEVVYVAVPNHLHYLCCKKSLEANKHVICEKPFTSNEREAKDLARLANEKKLILLEAVTTRYLPNTLKLKEKLKDLGDIKIASFNYSQYSSRYDAFKRGEIMPAFNPEMSGGALMDLNIYNINLAVMLFGEPKDIDYSANIEKGIDTSGILLLDYGNFKCVCIAAKDCKAPISSSIQGDKGCIHITSSANMINNFSILMNDSNDAKQINANADEIVDYNAGKHRMYHEFAEFTQNIEQKDYDKAEEMMKISLITMHIQSKARKKAGIVFAAD